MVGNWRIQVDALMTIAQTAGCATGTFYKHFRDKREIFLAVYGRWLAAVGGAVADVWPRGTAGLVQELSDFWTDSTFRQVSPPLASLCEMLPGNPALEAVKKSIFRDGLGVGVERYASRSMTH